jgi:hypothetical protein
MITRWDLAKLKSVIVEGAYDERLLRVLTTGGRCGDALRALSFLSVEAIELPSDLPAKHGIAGSGAKQRVVAFAREVEASGPGPIDGFRCIVDKDLDPFVGVDFTSPVLRYTDHACMDSYTWTAAVLRQLLVQFRCEHAITSEVALGELYRSICTACIGLSAVRLVSAERPELGLTLHRSEKPLRVEHGRLLLDLTKYVEQARPPRGELASTRQRVTGAYDRLASNDPLDLVNGHDLMWLLTFALRELSALPRRAIDPEVVEGTAVAFGVLDEGLKDKPLIRALSEWAVLRR